MSRSLIASIDTGNECPIPTAEIVDLILAALDALESLRTGQGVDILRPVIQFELVPDV